MESKKNKTHFFNEVYTKKDRYIKPKEIFINLIKILKKEKLNKTKSLIDIGCASGELLFNLNRNFENLNLTGLDVDKKLILKARDKCPKSIKFMTGDISKKIKNVGKFDIIILSGVMSIFDNGDKIMTNLFSILKPNGRIFIFDSLNIYSFNLYIKSEEIKKKRKISGLKICTAHNFLKIQQKDLKKSVNFLNLD